MRRAIFIIVAVIAVSSAVAILATALIQITQAEMPKWALARASGVVSYLLLWLATVLGILVSHPDSHSWNWANLATRLRFHIGFAVFAIVFTLLHIVVLATDEYAKVGWLGAFLPMAAEYRPVPITLGVLAFWGMVLASLTASLANTRAFCRSWLPIHRISLAFFVLAWVHGLFSGSDSLNLLALYLTTGVFVVTLATWRYAAPSIAQRRKTFARRTQTELKRGSK